MPFGKSLAQNRIFARPRQPRHHCHFATGIVISFVIGVAVLFAKVEKTAVIRSESAWLVQTILFAGVFEKQINVIEQVLLVVTDTTQGIGARHLRQIVTTRRLTDAIKIALGVGALDKE